VAGHLGKGFSEEENERERKNVGNSTKERRGREREKGCKVEAKKTNAVNSIDLLAEC